MPTTRKPRTSVSITAMEAIRFRQFLEDYAEKIRDYDCKDDPDLWPSVRRDTEKTITKLTRFLDGK